MAIKYESRYHSDDDPGGLIREVLELGPAFPGPAQDLLLAWMLRLEADRDPAVVAQRLLQAYGVAEGPLPGGACGELVQLLRETSTYGADRLRSHGGKRRGRRR
ncbi:MAG TPA: hypothetical protein VKN76_10480 [Kiloniellaceae bacterium]|nr:hypothetical protein [Kiloniellaceae bacterium]